MRYWGTTATSRATLPVSYASWLPASSIFPARSPTWCHWKTSLEAWTACALRRATRCASSSSRSDEDVAFFSHREDRSRPPLPPEPLRISDACAEEIHDVQVFRRHQLYDAGTFRRMARTAAAGNLPRRHIDHGLLRNGRGNAERVYSGAVRDDQIPLTCME